MSDRYPSQNRGVNPAHHDIFHGTGELEMSKENARETYINQGGQKQREATHAPLSLVVSPVCRRIENGRFAVRRPDVAGPQIAVQEAGPDLPVSGEILEEQMQSGRYVVIPKLRAVRVPGEVQLMSDSMIPEKSDPFPRSAVGLGPWIRLRCSTASQLIRRRM